MPVNMPSNAAITGLSPWSSAFCSAGNGEERQSHGIEPENVVAKAIRSGMPNESDQTGDVRHADVLPVGDSRGWYCADQQITGDSARVPRCE